MENAAPIYAVGDIHGQIAMLDDVLDRIERDGGSSARVVFVGDYIDRGPDSRAVLERLARGRAEGRDWIFLKGNHDRMFEWFLAEPRPLQDPHLLVGYHWLHENLGGRETLASYGLVAGVRTRLKDLATEARNVVPEHHKDFLRGLRLWHAEGGLFFAHAGVRPRVPLDRQDEEDLLWIRREFLDDPRDHGAFVIHGHTPVDAPDMRSNRLNIDTGAGYGRRMTAVVIEAGKIWSLEPMGRAHLGDLPARKM